MGLCHVCGKKTSWLSRGYGGGNEFCGRRCRENWEADLRKRIAAENAAKTAAATEAKERRDAAKKEERAAKKARKKEAEVKAQAKLERPIRNKSDGLRKKIRRRPEDPYLRLELALTMAELSGSGAWQSARHAFDAAFALGFPNSRDLGLARYEHGRFLSKRESFEEDVKHQYGQGIDDLKRHLRYEPDDVEALATLVKMSEHLGRETAKWKDQLRIAKRRKSIARSSGAKAKRQPDRTGIVFEDRCLAVVRGLGLTAVTTTATADGGIDILARSDNPLLRGRVAIQCKDWQDTVGEPVLRDLLGVVTAEKALKGVLITSSSFTPAAIRFAEGNRLELIDGEDLARLEASVGT